MNLFVGREAELAALERAADRARHAKGGMVLITGAPGLGKSTLVERFSRRIAAAEFRVLHGLCSPQFGMGEAYLPFKQVLSHFLSGEDGGADRHRMMALFEELAPSWIQLVPVAGTLVAAGIQTHSVLRKRNAQLAADFQTREQLLSEYVELLQHAAMERPLILVLEDLHWADYSSIDVLGLLARSTADIPLLTVGTFRREEAIASHHPLVRLAAELESSGTAQVHSLSPFSESETGAFLDALYPGHRFEPELVGQLSRATGGSPLFVREVLRFAEEKGWIFQREERWECSGSLESLSVPERIEGMIRRSFLTLNEAQLRLLRLGAVQGLTFTSDVLGTLTADEEFELDEQLKQIAATTATIAYARDREYPDGDMSSEFRFTHVLYREVLYRDLTSKQRVSVHARIAEHLARHYERGAAHGAVEIAGHWREGRRPGEAGHWYQIAAEAALAQFAFREAADHFASAMALLRASGERLDRTGPLFEAEARARLTFGELERVLALYGDLIDQARSEGDDRWHGLALTARASVYAYPANRPDEALRDLDTADALATGTGDPMLRARALSVRRQVLSQHMAETLKAAALTAELETLLPKLGDVFLTAENDFYAGLIAHHRGDERRAELALVRASGFARTARSALYYVGGHAFAGLATASRGEYRRGYELLIEAQRLGRELQEVYAHSASSNMLGWLHREFGDEPGAFEWNMLSLETSRSVGVIEPQAQALINLMEHYLAEADTAAALRCFEASQALRERHAAHWWRYTMRGLVTRGLLWLQEGDLVRGEADAAAAMVLARKTQGRKYLGRVRLLEARLAAAAGTRGLPRALRRAQAAYRLLRRLESPRLQWEALQLQSELWTAFGDDDRARACALAAGAQVDGMLQAAPTPALVEALRNSAAYHRTSEAIERLSGGPTLPSAGVH